MGAKYEIKSPKARKNRKTLTVYHPMLNRIKHSYKPDMRLFSQQSIAKKQNIHYNLKQKRTKKDRLKRVGPFYIRYKT